MKLYGISGLGADKRVFDFLSIDYPFIPIDWIAPLHHEKLEEYAKRIAKAIDTTEEFGIVGVSFGGLVATEISKNLNPRLTILISSAETKSDLPAIVRAAGKSGLLKHFPTKFFMPPICIASYFFGTQHKVLLASILRDTDPEFVKWAVNELVTWQNNTRLAKVLKISGTNDKLLPPRDKASTTLIEGGEHLMIVDKADEISRIINESINRSLAT